MLINKYFNIKFYLTILSIIFTYYINYLSAANMYDCIIALQTPEELTKKINSTNKIFTKEDILIVHKHLKDSCCSQKIIKSTSCTTNSSLKFPVSPYLILHLIDLGFKKLDGDKTLAYGELDPDGEARFQEMKKINEDPKGNSSELIKSLFDKYWKVGQLDGLDYKYKLVCIESYNIASTPLPLDNTERLSNEKIMDVCLAGDMKSYNYDGFAFKANSSVKSAMDAVKVHMKTKGYKLVIDNFRKYALDYFVKNRWDVLKQKFDDFYGYLGIIVKKVNEFTPGCSG